MRKKIAEVYNDSRIHIFAWTIFILYETIVIGILFNVFGNPFTYLLHYLVIICFFYFVSDCALPWALKFKHDSAWKMPVAALTCLAGYIFFQLVADLFLVQINVLTKSSVHGAEYQLILKNLYRGIYFMGFATAFYFLKTYTRSKMLEQRLREVHLLSIIKQHETEKELSKARNAFLKAQINPHFLFNTLDFIYHKVESQSVVASRAVEILSKMMRYAVDSDKNGDTVLLIEEIEQVENLLYLYQLRKGDELGIVLNYSSEIADINIIPLVVLTLVENILKHGKFGPSDDEASINIFIENEILHVRTDNLIKENSGVLPSHRGLENIHKRLLYSYGDDVNFHYTKSCGRFIVNIIIPVQKLKLPFESTLASISKR